MPRSDRDDDDDDTPRPAKRRDADAGREERRPAKRRDDDDDEDRRPAKRRARDEDEVDDYDDAPQGRQRKARGGGKGDGDGFATVVPYRNGPELAAYYCGVFGLIPGVGFLLGPIAFILGIVGLVKVRKNPKAKGTGHAIAGLVLGFIDPILWIVLWYLVFQDLTKPG
jgi:hypothetical protein